LSTPRNSKCAYLALKIEAGDYGPLQEAAAFEPQIRKSKNTLIALAPKYSGIRDRDVFF